MSKNVALSYEGACHRCGMPGHIARNCPQPRICTKCGMGGHVAKFCGQKQLTAKDKMLAKYSEVCHRCGNKGHMARECSSVAFKCRICGEDHHQSECPKNTGTLENMMKRKTYETSEFAKQKLAAEVAEMSWFGAKLAIAVDGVELFVVDAKADPEVDGEAAGVPAALLAGKRKHRVPPCLRQLFPRAKLVFGALY